MATDELKPISELFSPDPRHSLFALLDPTTGSLRPITIEDHYSMIADSRLSASVPSDIRIQFETARNLLLYAWFAYRFIPVAQLQAYTVLEYALRLRINQQGKHDPRRRSQGLKQLLQQAIEQGWIRDNGIRQYKRIEERQLQSRETMEEILGEKYLDQGSSAVQAYTSVLVSAIPRLRNELAHGGSLLTLMKSAYLTIEICCDLINQLYSVE